MNVDNSVGTDPPPPLPLRGGGWEGSPRKDVDNFGGKLLLGFSEAPADTLGYTKPDGEMDEGIATIINSRTEYSRQLRRTQKSLTDLVKLSTENARSARINDDWKGAENWEWWAEKLASLSGEITYVFARVSPTPATDDEPVPHAA